ncbi:Protein of unknown function [Bacillus cereus]|nr:Protein of unknown function [Bacillus cereus]
MYYIVVSKG